ncbi:MAG: hypothetical protein IPI67_14775 [Myxococcales bacterium]|nr:hypothetical protein [Myxococcales bacterium]
MRRHTLPTLLALATFATTPTWASPAHDICADLGPTLGVGVSSFSAAGDWPVVAEQQHGVDWKFLYLYVVPNNDPKPDVAAFLTAKASLAKSLGAVPVFTFYELLQLGQQKGISGSEADVVKATLADPALMKRYFEDFVFLLQTAEKSGAPSIVHVEPDSWGFMIWAMGVEGNADASSIPVAVASSGAADVAGFANDASGLGKALLALRDKFAPSVRLGWHASNFRVGQKPEVVTGFYSSLGEWDVLVTEQPHLEANEATWWEPWDTTLLDTNVAWFSALSSATGLPVLLWQAQIGTTDYHFFDSEPAALDRFAKAGLGGVLFDMRGSGNPDDFRAYESAKLATVPPSSSTAGGTAADMRTRLASYAKAPLVWPAGSPCASGGGASGAGGGGAAAGGGGGSGERAGGAGGSTGAPRAAAAATTTAVVDVAARMVEGRTGRRGWR